MITSTIVDIIIALASVIAAPLIVQGLVQARSTIGRVLQVAFGLALAVTFLVIWGHYGHDPMQIAYCWVDKTAPSCVERGSTPPELDNNGIGRGEYDTAEDGLPLLRRVLAQKPIEDLEASAEGGDGEAQYLMGIAKWRGIGTREDLNGAREYLRRSVLSGFKRATLAYGSMLAGGLGGPKNVEEALSWWQSGADAGFAPCLYVLGTYYAYQAPENERNIPKARDYIEKAAAKEHAGAYATLGDFAWYGTGQPVDKAAALKLYEKAAKMNSSLAMRQLANAYRYGDQYPLSKPKALGWFKRAAFYGDGYSAVQAASMLTEGEGVDKDFDAAARILQPIANDENYQAMAQLSKLVIDHKVDAIAGVDAEAMAIQADEHGFPDGIGALTADLREGKNGWQRDIAKAALLSRDAYKRGATWPLSQEGAWPLWQKGFAYTVQLGLKEGAVTEAYPGEGAELERLFGSPDKNMKTFKVPMNCSGTQSTYDTYVWDAPNGPVPTDLQFDWLQQARGCSVPADVRTSFDKLFQIARNNNVSFMDLAVYALGEAKKQPPAK
ncbi:MAG: DUF2610 domain-containing protein [Alphaproteobacteria bacterium]|nr:DUF2610 domain-containing protein [Alphaproteobacteria bacterium]